MDKKDEECLWRRPIFMDNISDDMFQEMIRRACPGVKFVDCTPQEEEFDGEEW